MLTKRLTSIATVILALALAPTATGQDFDLSWDTIDGGGGSSSTGGDFELFGTIGQPDLCRYDVDCDGQINPVDSGIVQSLYRNVQRATERMPVTGTRRRPLDSRMRSQCQTALVLRCT